MPSASKPWWQQATALVSLGAGGADHRVLLRPAAGGRPDVADEHAGAPAWPWSTRPSQQHAGRRDAAVGHRQRRQATTCRMAESKTASRDAGDHLAARQRRRRRPWRILRGFCQPDAGAGRPRRSASRAGSPAAPPTHGRCTTGPMSASTPIRRRRASPRSSRTRRHIDRWHALGDGYQPLPGDWVVFDGHVEVVTKYADGLLSHDRRRLRCPDFSVNAHEYPRSARRAGRPSASSTTVRCPPSRAQGCCRAAPPHQRASRPRSKVESGSPAAGGQRCQRSGSDRPAGRRGVTMAEPSPAGATADATVIPGLPMMAHRAVRPPESTRGAAYQRGTPVASSRRRCMTSAASRRSSTRSRRGDRRRSAQYGVPASVTIAQAIDESGWGQSTLATRTTTCSASRARARLARDRAAEPGVPERPAGDEHQLIPRLQQRLRRASTITASSSPPAATTARPWPTGGTRTPSRSR